MQLTLCEPSAMSAAVVMDPPAGVGLLQSYGTEDRSASLEDITASESAANSESSEEEREEEVRAIPADPAPITSASPAPIASETPASAGDTRTQPGTVPRPASLSLASSDELKLWTSRRDGEVKLRVSESGPASEPPVTVHQMFTSTVERYGAYPALGWKEGDQWKTLNYKDYYQQCRTAAKGFLKLGLERYHGVGILGFNSAEWFIADIAAILAGGFAVGIYTTNSAEACQYVAENCQANILVVENHKQLQKILQVQDKLPHLKAIIQYKDELKEKRPSLFTWAEFMELGQEVSDSQLDDIISSQKPNQCCTLIYTSGTTGQPKGVMLSHDNLTWTAFGAGRHVRLTEASVLQEVVVSYLPLSHIAAQMIDIWLIMKVGGVSYFAQPDALKGSLANTLREIRPTAFMGVPRVWEKMQEKMKSVGAKSSAVRRKVAAWAKDVGLSTNLSRMQRNGETTDREPLNYRLARKLVFRKVRKALGLDRCSKCYTGAAPITKDTLEFFLSLDVPVYELYGMSESTGPHTVSLPDAFRLTSCGKVIPGCETKIFRPDEEGNGEICFWGRHVFMGYLNSADKTEEALDSDGWLHSGDLGKHDEQDFLFITGRIKELIITAGGENIPPVPIEDEVKAAVPLISNAMLIGDKRKFLTMLLTIKSQVNEDSGAPEDELTEEAVALCQRLGSSATRVSEIAGGRDRAVHAAIQEGINRVNEHATSNAQRIQKWTVLDRDFSILGGELGPTMKLKRPVVMKMYKEQIENFYKEVATPTTPDNPLPPK
ncbi:long-chain-fatty-acid--CoA ligase ACSBG2 isoform X1 [Anguilla anguilla]|uniref:long-chain-fatty-acid--CoA ligase ACSBG2 isoform X1 n=2 Tax=Anguilla anguilla TaxID=7936 RepID=UPI0015B30B61|nr:long-chain-fatty-acid--CoA ligase ACSBG2 isoform X1 [Anguilla anguilla]XP_035269951.1 long-chain-fatty-acid--CoA ligase ACSBG2 isoform X1 [Anguilla anguilla]